MLEGNWPGPNCKVHCRHLPGVTQEKRLENLCQCRRLLESFSRTFCLLSQCSKFLAELCNNQEYV